MKSASLSLKIFIIFDNRCVKKDFLIGFGFSALVYNYLTHNYLLFDTGGNAKVLIHNLRKFNIDGIYIKKVIIFDNHAGGLDGIYKKNSKILNTSKKFNYFFSYLSFLI